MTQQFTVIYADPPWGTYRDKCNSGARGAGHKYPIMSMRDLMVLPVDKLAAKDAALFMWIPTPLLEDGLALARAWGFPKYVRRAFLWVKIHASGKPAFGMGHWTRGNAEECYLFTRGRPRVVSHSVSELFMGPPLKPHSAKPPAIRDLIVTLMGDVPRVELFARTVDAGWHSIGNEIDGQDIATALPVFFADFTGFEPAFKELTNDRQENS